jgi:quinol-cytochrome oxidoreductase complex cytochrome b subunit
MDFIKNKRNVIIFAVWIFIVSMLIGGYVAYNSPV